MESQKAIEPENESTFIFKGQIDQYDASYHVQRENYEKFQQLVADGKAVVLMDEAEHEQLEKDLKKDKLKYSNDANIDMIVEKVYNHTQKEDLKNIIDCIKIANLPTEIPGRSFEKYFDDSFFTSLGRPFLLIIRQLSDIMACFFLNDFNPIESQHFGFYFKFISILIKEIKKRQDELYNTDYTTLQYYMKYIEDHIYPNFTTLLIFFSREIEEMAVAFLAGHELGHHALGHTTKENHIERSWDIEYAADQFGFDFAIEYLNACMKEKSQRQLLPPEYVQVDDDITYRLIGILLIFHATKLYSGTASMGIGSHPPVDEREKKVYGYLKEKYGDSMIKTLQEYLKRFEGTIAGIEEIYRFVCQWHN